MSKVFYLNEILNFAVEKEQQAADLYQKLADRSSDNPERKALFEKLVQDELGHKKFYAEILAETKDDAPHSEEYTAYMRQLIEDGRTTEPLPDDISGMPFNDILEYAIAREKDSVMFYLGLRQYVPKSAYDKVDQIIAEEAKHAAIIANLKE